MNIIKNRAALLSLALLSSVAACSVGPKESFDDSSQDVTTGNKFLSALGAGSQAEAQAYYQSIGAPTGYTLAQWKTDNLSGATLISSFYRNTNDLGFWRDMTCSQTLARGGGGCFVTNYRNEGDKAAGAANLGTVAMNVSAGGFTRFYAFGPDGTLSPSVALDTEGPKFLPRVCATCHGGLYRAPSADVGSVFREWEPSLLQEPSNADSAALATQFYALNQAARSANVAVHAQSEGAPFGTDHAKAAQNAYIDAIYVQSSPPVSRTISDPFHLPSAWNLPSDPNATLIQAMWTQFVNQSCMGCHRLQPLDFSNYAMFSTLAHFQGSSPRIQLLVSPIDFDHDAVTPYMPHAQVTFNNLQANGVAKATIQSWAAALGGSSAMDQIYFPQDCQTGTITSAELANLAVYGATGFPFVGEFVVQKRSCATRSTGNDCTPWEEAPCSVNDPVTDTNCQNSRHIGVLSSNGSGIHTNVGNGEGVNLAQPAQTDEAWTVTMPGLPNSVSLAAAQPAQMTPTCFRVPVPNQTTSTGAASFDEFRAALVAQFSADLYVDPDPNSPLNASACTGPNMTVAQAESRFPAGSGLTRVPVPASISVTVGQRDCQAGPAGVTCGPFSTQACSDPWCVTAALARSVSFVEQGAGNVAISFDTLNPALSVTVGSGAVAPGAAAGIQGTVLAPPTNTCLRIPLRSAWTGSPSGGWTETFGALLAKY
jgi:hypothetical protein